MIKTIFSSLIALAFSAIALYSQSYNNDYPIDSIDVMSNWEMNGFSAFKFPVELTGDQFVIYSYEIYENGELMESNDKYDKIMSDSTSFYRSFMDAEKNGDYLRVYWKELDDNILCSLKFASSSLQYGFEKKGELHQTADRSAKELSSGQKTLLCMRYSYDEGTDMINCAGDADAKSSAQKYDHVIAIYAQIVSPSKYLVKE